MEKGEATFAELMADGISVIDQVFRVEHKKKRKAWHDTNNVRDFARVVSAGLSQREREDGES